MNEYIAIEINEKLKNSISIIDIVENSDDENNIYVSERIIVLPDRKAIDNAELVIPEILTDENHVAEAVKEDHYESESSYESINDAYPISPILYFQDSPSDPSNRNIHRNCANHRSIAKDGMGISANSPYSPSYPSSHFCFQSYMLSQYQEDSYSHPSHPERPPTYSLFNETNHFTSSHPHHCHKGNSFNDYLNSGMDNDNVLPVYTAITIESSPSLRFISISLTNYLNYSTEFENDTTNETLNQHSSTIPRGTNIGNNMTCFMNRNPPFPLLQAL
ncbi:hypothetical protein H8356DRAFT_1047690 [Neocallimastix lanati (nom. inval.)]|nr:hypothetical protein H8356DRAFT_1047690 [Neocallimastix sp. JGI-2020a]